MCDMDFDGDRPDVWRETFRKARKEHKCGCCSRTIAFGERYLVHFMAYDGMTWDDKMCSECATDRAKFAKEPGHYLPVPAEFDDALNQCIADEPSAAKRWQPMLDRILVRRYGRPLTTSTTTSLPDGEK